MRKITAEELHKTLLDIAKEFDKICRKNDIPYYMLGGTMLGAVRHKGFIPWDDDMDFGVMRPDFERLKEALKAELPERYVMNTMDNCDMLFSDFIKISDNNTLIKELYKKHCKDELGVNIDVFPLDYTNGNKGLLSTNLRIYLLLKIQNNRFADIHPRALWKNVLAVLVKILFCATKRRSIINYINKHLKREGDYIANTYGAWGLKEIMPKEWMGTPKPYAFEDTELMGVEDAHRYLTSLYGDYMELPPEDKRHIHIENMWFR